MHFINQPYVTNDFFAIFGAFVSTFIFLIVLDGVLKAIALWKAARANQLAWFVALIIFNTVGVLPIIYLLFFVRKNVNETVAAPIKKPAKKTVKRTKR